MKKSKKSKTDKSVRNQPSLFEGYRSPLKITVIKGVEYLTRTSSGEVIFTSQVKKEKK